MKRVEYGANMTNSKLSLSDQEFENLVDVLQDIRQSVTCEIAVGGSIAQRALIPQFAESDLSKKISDIDLVLLGGSFENCPVQPDVKKYFNVLSINKSFDGYYFGLVHKKTKKWVDLFTPAYKRTFDLIQIGGMEYKAETIPSQVLYLAHDLLWRAKYGREIRQKWIDKLRYLFELPSLDASKLEKEFSDNQAYLLEDFPSDLPSPDDAKSFVQSTLKYVAPSKNTTKWRWLSFFKNYYTDSIKTSNGIEVDSRTNMLRRWF